MKYDKKIHIADINKIRGIGKDKVLSDPIDLTWASKF
uniref:Uncharacterized protein n=1 Tax=Rhizophora mucronata TaxID=61149 RepID=A0A2P2PAA9_RHIMU